MGFNWSFRAFTLFGTVVRIHWSLPAFVLYYVMRATSQLRQAQVPLDTTLIYLGLFVIAPFVLLFGSVLAHEFGHIFAARYYGLRVGETILTPIGGMVMVGRSRTPQGEFVVAAGGPAVNVALALGGLVLYLALGGPVAVGTLLPMFGGDPFGHLVSSGQLGLALLHDFIQTNAMLFLFNVAMVAYPMDGGRMVFAGLWRSRGYRPAMVLACKLSRVVAVLMGLVAIVTFSFVLGIIALFVWLQATAMLQRVPLLDDPSVGFSPGYQRALLAQRRHVERELKRVRPGRLQAWLERRHTQRYVELLAKAESKGLQSLSRSEREFLKSARGRKH